jgi:archaeal flagellar protein FlaJ
MDEKIIKLIVLIISAVLVLIGYFSKDVGVFANTLIIATFISFATFGFFEYRNYREWKEKEEMFPLFLRHLIENLASGIPLYKAIKILSKNDYKSLNREISFLSNQISWNIPIHKALDKICDKLKRSKRLQIGFKIIREAYISGGNMVAVLTSLSESMLTLQQLEKERKSILNQYTLMMYAITFIFIGVVIMINKLLLPIFSNIQGVAIEGENFGLTDPCSTCSGASCNLCDFFALIANNVIGLQPEKPYYYVSIFFLLSLIQALFAGLVAGQVSEGSIKAGIRHSIILVTISTAIYLFLFRIGFIGV